MSTLDSIKVGSMVWYEQTGRLSDIITINCYQERAFKKAIVTRMGGSDYTVYIIFEDCEEETLLNIFDCFSCKDLPTVVVSNEPPTKGHIRTALKVLKSKCKMVGESPHIRFDTSKSKKLAAEITDFVNLISLFDNNEVNSVLLHDFHSSIEKFRQHYEETNSETCKWAIENFTAKVRLVENENFKDYWKELLIPVAYHQHFKGE